MRNNRLYEKKTKGGMQRPAKRRANTGGNGRATEKPQRCHQGRRTERESRAARLQEPHSENRLPHPRNERLARLAPSTRAPPSTVGRRNRSLALLSYLLARAARSPPRRGSGGRQRATKGFALLNWDRLYRFTTDRGSPAPAPVEIGTDGQRESGSQPFTY